MILFLFCKWKNTTTQEEKTAPHTHTHPKEEEEDGSISAKQEVTQPLLGGARWFPSPLPLSPLPTLVVLSIPSLRCVKTKRAQQPTYTRDTDTRVCGRVLSSGSSTSPHRKIDDLLFNLSSCAILERLHEGEISRSRWSYLKLSLQKLGFSLKWFRRNLQFGVMIESMSALL